MALIDINTLNKSNKLFRTIPLLIFAIALGIGIFYAGYFFGKLKMQNEKLKIEKEKTQISPTAHPQSAQGLETRWKEYIDESSNFSFSYPPDWEIVDGAPEHDMLKRKCSGPILRKKTNPSTLIAISIIPPELTHATFCWSEGYFWDYSKRTISTLGKEIEVSKWRPQDIYDPKTGETKPSPWEGYFMQTYTFNSSFKERPQDPMVIFALIHKKDEDKQAEDIFDQILATFKFLEKDKATSPTAGWFAYENPSFPFTFRYPKEAQIREEENTVVLIIKGPTQRENTEVYDAVYLRFSISDSQGKSLEEYVVEELNRSKELGEIIQPMEQIQINGIQGLAYTVRTTGTLRNIYLASPTGKIIKIVDGTNDPTNQGFKKISQNILATFEFLD